jgi:ElaB/YqjD/DUF883 family membrane-anchored ribosome-binding protein
MTTASATKSASTQPKSDLDQIRDDVHAIREDFKSLASNTAKLAAGHFKEQSRRASALAGTAASKAGDYRDLISDKVKDHPLASVGAAVLVGLAMSSMRRR